MTSVPTTPTVATFSGLASGIDTAGLITTMTQFAQKGTQQLSTEDDALSTKLKAWQSFSTQVVALQGAALTLTLPTTFNAVSGASSTAAVATINATSSAALGTHTLTVNHLAKAQELITGSQTSNASALGYSGSFTINGKVVNITNSDALNDVASKINSAKAGVTAAVVNIGPNNYQMTLTSNATGTINSISAVDNSGGILNGLGLVSSTAATAARQTISYSHNTTTYTGAASLSLSSAEQSVASVLGMTTGSAPAGTVQINGVNVSIDLNQDNLNTIASKINQAGISGVSAQIVASTDANGNPSGQQLEIVNATTAPASAAPPTFTDNNNVLATLGVVQSAYTNTPITQAQDSNFTLDGLTLTRSANTVGDVINGASVTLLQDSTMTTTPATTSLSISQNTDTATKAATDFATAYNAIVDYVSAQNAFTPPTGSTTGTAVSTPPLFGDSTLSSIQAELARTLSVTSGKMSLPDIGITLDSQGHVTVDSTKLANALTTNPTQVSGLLNSAGTADNSNVQYLASSAKTQPSSGTGFTVSVTQAATQATIVAGVKQTGASTAPETLTFGGSSFVSPVKLTLVQGNQLQDTVNQINSDGDLTGKISASIDPVTGALKLVSPNYGNNTSFSVTSDTAASSTSSGLAFTTNSSVGLNVAGTINGEPALGVGRVLSGNSGNKTTDGLQVKVNTATTGVVGHVSIVQGMASTLGNILNQILDPTSGSITGAENALNSQMTDLEAQITAANDQVATYTAYLQQTFTAMETRVSQLQTQGAAFAAQIGATSAASSPSSSSSSSTTKTGA